jgi:hypothetical protein
MFRAMIHENDSLPEIQEFHYLKSSLSGEAERLVSNLPMTANNYTIAWKLLVGRYENKRLIAASHIRQLLGLKQLHKESASEFAELVNTISNNVNALQALNIQASLSDVIISQIITEKLDSTTCKASFNIANRDETELMFKTSEIFNEINKWFHSNLLMLNYDKTYFLQFVTKTDNEINMQVPFGNRKIATVQSLEFLGLTVDTTFTWKQHIGEITSRPKKACYAIMSIKLFMSLDLLRSTYFSYAHSIIFY